MFVYDWEEIRRGSTAILIESFVVQKLGMAISRAYQRIWFKKKRELNPIVKIGLVLRCTYLVRTIMRSKNGQNKSS